MTSSNAVANTLPLHNENLNTDDAVHIDQQILKKVPLIVPEESEYTLDVTKKEE